MRKANPVVFSILPFLMVSVGLIFSPQLKAHSPLFDCFDNGDNTITCEGGFSDGASTQGILARVLNAQGKVLEQGEMDVYGSVSFAMPDQQYSVVFNAGEGHRITIFGDDIF